MIGNTSVLNHTMRRLACGLKGIVNQFVLLSHTNHCGEDTASAVNDNQFRHVIVDSGSREYGSGSCSIIDDLRYFAQLENSGAHLLVLPDNCVFTDCVLASLLIDQHRLNGDDCTVPADYPFGLVPIAFRSQALIQLPEFAHATGDLNFPGPLAAVFRHLGTRARTQRSISNIRSVKLELFPAEPVPASVRAALPLRLTMEDCHLLSAATRVQMSGAGEQLDSTAAQELKKELLKILECPRPSECNDRTLHRGKPVNVLFCSMRNAYSGPEQCLLMLMQGLDRALYRPVLVVPSNCLLAERATAAGIPVKIADFRADLCMPISFAYWQRIIEQYEIGLVHIDVQINPALTMTAYHEGIPVVGHLRGEVPEDLPDAAYCLDRMIVVSEFIAESLKKTHFSPSRIAVVYDGVQTARFATLRHGDQQPRKSNLPMRIALVARINSWKRQDLLIEAMSLLRGSGMEFKVVLFGDIDPAADSYNRQIRRMVEDKGLKDNVIFWGFESDIDLIYKMSDVLVQCSPREPLGTCVLEAMAAGIPVIAPNSGGSPEMVRHWKEGLLFQPGDASALAENLLLLASNPDLYSEFSVNAQRRAVNLFDISSHVSQLQRVYEELIEAPGRLYGQAGLVGLPS